MDPLLLLVNWHLETATMRKWSVACDTDGTITISLWEWRLEKVNQVQLKLDAFVITAAYHNVLETEITRMIAEMKALEATTS